MQRSRPVVAHFLLSSELSGSPPNEAIVSAFVEAGCDVELFGPYAGDMDLGMYSGSVHVGSFKGGWGYRGLVGAMPDFAWRRYCAFSATAEDPLPIAACLAKLHRKPMIALVDEIKSGSYVGDRSARWKALCKWAIRSASLCIVNDESRVALVRDYSGRAADREVLVYPGCFRSPPPVDIVAIERMRAIWGARADDLVVGVSGGVNLTAGFDWVHRATARTDHAFLLVQPVNLDPFTDYLLRSAVSAGRGYVEKQRLSWYEAWVSAAACDVGIAIYRNSAPQFQRMGISSNRLCMYLAMGVPVIASRQESFQFIEDFNCGVLVNGEDEVAEALSSVRKNLTAMRNGTMRATREHIRADSRYRTLVGRIQKILNA